jgi:AraC-like DNA-binding protein
MEHTYTSGIAITFFLVLILISKKQKSSADITLAAWLALTGVHIALFYLFFTDKMLDFPCFLGLEAPLPLFQGPFLLLYTATLSNQALSNSAKILHFSVPMLWYLLFIPFMLLPPEHKIWVYQNKGIGYETLSWCTSWTINISGVFYVVLSFRVLEKYRSTIQDKYAYTEKINLNWLRYLIWGIAGIWLVVFWGNDTLIFFSAVLYVCFIGFFGIKQVGVFTNGVPTQILTNPLSVQYETTIKYEKSGLSDEAAQKMHQALVASMEKEKLFTNTDLTLAELARHLGVHANYLSQVINSFEQVNFYDYINIKRVEEFKKIAPLPKSQQFTLLSLAYDCGFNSKTSFNRNFKKATGLSPSEYLNQQQVVLK